MNITIKSLRQARKKKVLIKVISVFADDSCDEKCERIFVVASIWGTQEEWDTIEVNWIKRTGGKIFHATDCESGYGDYKGIPREKRHREYKDLTKILAASPMMGVGSAIDVKAYRTFMPDALEDAPYFQCFVRVILETVKWARLIIPQQKIKFTFDINHKVQYNAAFLYENLLVKRPEYIKYTSLMDKDLGFATSETVGIQVADLFTRETMKHYDNQFGPIQRPLRLSMDALIKTKKFLCTYYHENYFKAFKEKLKELEQETGLSQEDYQKWQLKHNCQDNAENRIRYAIYKELIEDV